MVLGMGGEEEGEGGLRKKMGKVGSKAAGGCCGSVRGGGNTVLGDWVLGGSLDAGGHLTGICSCLALPPPARWSPKRGWAYYTTPSSLCCTLWVGWGLVSSCPGPISFEVSKGIWLFFSSSLRAVP